MKSKNQEMSPIHARLAKHLPKGWGMYTHAGERFGEGRGT